MFTTTENCDIRHITLLTFAYTQIDIKRKSGKISTAEKYSAAIASFMRYRNGIDIAMRDVDGRMICDYESYLQHRGITRNSSSFYMRNLRAIYNRAVRSGAVEVDCNPFAEVYTGVARTAKRSITTVELQRLASLNLAGMPRHAFARDLFLLSFMLHGMSFVDICFLRKTDLRGGILTYNRHKTHTTIHIRWIEKMQQLLDRMCVDSRSKYLLPIIKSDAPDARKAYRSAGCLINRYLHRIGEMAHISIPLTLYVARHSWASLALNCSVPVSVISEAMGHTSERTTRIYLSSINASVVDRANLKITSRLRL